MDILVRPGTAADAPSAITTLRRSIAELCAADHQDDPQALAGWLGNKTPETWARWIQRSDATVLVAEMSGRIVGVGMVDRHGEILLNYVHPEARFCGVSTAVLRALESTALAQGVLACRVDSTETARAFYVRRGYLPDAGGACLVRRLVP